MSYSSFRNHKEIRQDQINFLGTLNQRGSVYLASSKDNEKDTFIVKIFQGQQNSSKQQLDRLRNLDNNTHNLVLKPSLYCHFPTNQAYIFYLCSKVEQISLESMLFLHRLNKRPFPEEIIRSFAKVYDTLNRMSKGKMVHGNLKPSNIFFRVNSYSKSYESQKALEDTINNQDIEWYLSEAGLLTSSSNKFYTKSNTPLSVSQNLSKSSKSMYVDPQENDFYAMGVMLLEMTTLDPIQTISESIKNNKVTEIYLENSALIDDQNLSNFIKGLLNPKEAVIVGRHSLGIKELYHNYHDEASKQRKFTPPITYSDFHLSEKTLKEWLQSGQVVKLFEKLKATFQDRKLKSRDVLHFLKKIDSNYDFVFQTSQDFELFLSEYDISLNQRELLMLGFFFSAESQIGYMQILIRALDHKDIIETIIEICIENYGSPQVFFETQSKGNLTWKLQDVTKFFQLLKIPFVDDQIRAVIKQWVKEGTDDKAVSYDTFKKIFRDSFQQQIQSKRQSTIKKSKNSKASTNSLERVSEVVNDLSKSQYENLVKFFRKLDLKGRWTVALSTIKEEICKYVKLGSKQDEKTVFEEIVNLSQVGDKKQIAYISLLKKVKLYEELDLFKMIITERINELGKVAFFDKYSRDEKGWNLSSFISFFEDECLEEDFSERELKVLFDTMDRDDSGYISLKELVYKVTGIKQFSIDSVIEEIKDFLKSSHQDLFDVFTQIDTDYRLELNGIKQMRMAFESMKMYDMPDEHFAEILKNYDKRGRFQYLSFFSYFYAPDYIFLKACRIILSEQYHGNFEKFFKLGLKGEKTKWTRQSLTLVNEALVLGFRQNELGEIWKTLDKNDERSLTKEEIGQIFNMKVERIEQFKGRAVESLRDFHPPSENKMRSTSNRFEAKNSKEKKDGSTLQNNQSFSHIDQLHDNELVKEMKVRNIFRILNDCYSESEYGCTVQILLGKFLRILQRNEISIRKGFIQTNFPKFIERKTDKIILLNYLKLFLLIAQYNNQPQKEKATIILWLLKTMMKEKKITVEDLYQKECRQADRMRLSDFQKIVKKITDCEIFFEDIGDVWEYCGNQKQISQETFEILLQEGGQAEGRVEMKRQLTFGGANKGTPPHPKNGYQNENQIETPYLNHRQDSIRESGNDRGIGRKDSAELKKFALTEKQRRESEYEGTGRFKKQTEKSFRRNDSQSSNRRSDPNRGHDQRQYHRQQSSSRSPERRTSMEQNLYEDKYSRKNDRIQDANLQYNQKGNYNLSKEQLGDKFVQMLQKKSSDAMTELFMNSNSTSQIKFSNCLVEFYGFDRQEADQMAEVVGVYGKVNIEKVKKYIKRSEQEKEDQSFERRGRDSRSEKQGGLYNRNKTKSRENRPQVQISTRTPEYFQSDKYIQPVTSSLGGKKREPEQKLMNPHKQLLNKPLIRSQIQQILEEFAQKYSSSELTQYFFGDIHHDSSLTLSEFSSKVKKVSSSISESMLEKIFLYMSPHPTSHEINIVSFQSAFNYDDGTPLSQEQYLPKELEKQLSELFLQHDKDKSGFIEPREVEALLATLGFNETQRQIESLFAKIDKNFDGKITYKEFKSFIEEFVIPLVSDFEDQADELIQMLRMNDVFNTGEIPVTTLIAIIERYTNGSVKITPKEGIYLAKYCSLHQDPLSKSDETIPIDDFISALCVPSKPIYPSIVKKPLYKIRLRKKVSLKQIQKVFQNISTNFVLAYTALVMKRQELKRSSPFEVIPHYSNLYYPGFYYKNIRSVKSNGNNEALLVDCLEMAQNSSQGNKASSQVKVAELKIKEACGVPIPQNSQIKNSILKRSINITLFDLSAESAKSSISSLLADWDSDVEDQWLFNQKNRSVFLKIGNYQPRRFEKVVVLFELIITLVDSGKPLDVSCGSASVPVREIFEVDGKASKQLKIISGIPNKSKEIDRVSVTKRSGWKSFLGSSDVDSELSLEVHSEARFREKTHMIYPLPETCLINRKALYYCYVFREYAAEKIIEGPQGDINPQFWHHHTVQAFLLSLDIDEVYYETMNFWKEKMEPVLKGIKQARQVMYLFLTDLYMIFNTKQFQLKPSNPCASVISNKSLYALRAKMVGEVFENILDYVSKGLAEQKPYRRIKNYSNYTYGLNEGDLRKASLQSFLDSSALKSASGLAAR